MDGIAVLVLLAIAAGVGILVYKRLTRVPAAGGAAAGPGGGPSGDTLELDQPAAGSD